MSLVSSSLSFRACMPTLLHAFFRRCWPVRCKSTQEDQAQQDKAERSSAAQNGSTHQDDDAASNDAAPGGLQKCAHLRVPLPASLCNAWVEIWHLLVQAAACLLCLFRRDTPWQWVDSEDALRTYIVFFGILLAGELPLLKVTSSSKHAAQCFSS